MNGKDCIAPAAQWIAEPYAEVAYRDLLLSLATSETEWLDLGCGRSLIRDWLPRAHETQMQLHRTCKRIAGIDLEETDVNQNPYIHESYVGNIEHLPFPDSSFNLVTAQMVVEHVPVPLAMLRESARVLAPGGHFVFVTPNLRNWLVAAASIVPDAMKRSFTAFAQRRQSQDIFPTHYRMNTFAAVRQTLRLAGMAPELIQFIDGSPDLNHVPVLERIERWVRALQPSACRSDILVHARKTPRDLKL